MAELRETTIFDPDANTPIYMGTCGGGRNSNPAAPVWTIQKFTYVNGAITKIEYAIGKDGKGVWNDRATYSYA